MDLVIPLICIIVLLWLGWRWRNISKFSKLGIPGPTPNIIFGNMLELYAKGPQKCHEEWVAKYGRILGYYYGMKPVLMVTDPMILKDVFIRDFNKFINREPFNPLVHLNRNRKEGQSILLLEGQEWKNVRSILTPTFTSTKMKQMAGSMHSSIDDMVKLMKDQESNGLEVDIHDIYQRMTMDVITRTAFGVRTDVQKNPNSKLLNSAKVLFNTEFRDKFIFVGLCFPLLRRLCLRLMFFLSSIFNKGINPANMLRSGIKQVIQHRKQNKEAKKNDLLQLMMDTEVSLDSKSIDVSQLEAGKTEVENMYDAEEKQATNKKLRSMNEDEIISSSFVVLLAGYETTSTALAFTSYALAIHQDIQERLYEEINQLIVKGEKLEYSTITKLPYLEKVLNESLRLYPPVNLFTSRYAMEDVHYDKVFIPKGTLIQAPVYIMHHDPEFWDEPYKYDPERFNDKPNANGVTYLPFGVGPRNCLGMRFAQLEAKLALANIIYNFRLHLADSQKEKLDVATRIRTLTPEKGVRVKLEARTIEPQS